MSDLAPTKVLEQIQKLVALASKNDNENEAAAAMAKAQSLLAEYNLTMEVVGEANVGDGAREQAAIEGGFFQFQRDLWEEVAALNFCLYWHQRVRNRKGLKNKYKEVRKWMFHNYLVGKKVNVAVTIAMQSYLEQTCTRLTKEHTQGMNNKHNLSNWANSYRRGIVERVCRKLRERRNEALKAEEEKLEAAMRAAAGTISTSTALTLSTYIDKETDANLDFIHGDGWSAKQAAQRAASAEDARKRREAYTKWAAANPEEARAEEEKRRKESSRFGRGGGKGSRGGKVDGLDSSAYWSGYEAGKSVSIDQQTGHNKTAGLL